MCVHVSFTICLMSLLIHREIKWTKDIQHNNEEEQFTTHKLLNIKIYCKALVFETEAFGSRMFYIN